MTMLISRRTTAPAAVMAALAGAVILFGLVAVCLNSAGGQDWDDSAMRTVVAGRDTQLKVLSVLGYISIGAIVVVVAGCALVALLRGKVQLAIGAIIVIAGANVTTQLLKQTLLTRPDFDLGTLNSLPSGHTTVAASAVGAALLVAPRLARPLIATVGGLVTTLTGASTIVAGWHRPSDVVAALAVSLIWTAAVAAYLSGPSQSFMPSALGALAGCAAALGFLVMIGVRPVMGWDGFTEAALVLGAVSAATALFVTTCAAISPED
ncbi:phosphatase PAP2 family protein [Aeromicrobium sp. P5_D10]